MGSYLLITGASGGLGKAFAIECASRGFDLILTDLNMKSLETLASAIRSQYGVQVIAKTANLVEEKHREDLLNDIREQGIQLQGIINIAGLDFEGPFLERTGAQIRTLLRLNVEAVLELSLLALSIRDVKSRFRIINVASMAGYYSMPHKALYASSKRMLLSFSMALREELKDQNVSVTILCPSGMPTNKEVIVSIASQGLAGEITTKNVGFVAYKTVKRALGRGGVYIPGTINRIILSLSRLVPDGLLTKIIGSRWEHAREIAHDM